jgi:chromosome partitioning protein
MTSVPTSGDSLEASQTPAAQVQGEAVMDATLGSRESKRPREDSTRNVQEAEPAAARQTVEPVPPSQVVASAPASPTQEPAAPAASATESGSETSASGVERQESASVDLAEDELSGDEVPPGLEPGLEEIVQRLVSPSTPSADQLPSNPEQPGDSHGPPDGAAVEDEKDADREATELGQPGGGRWQAIQASDPTSATGPQKENISPARTASRRGRGRMGQQSSPTRQLRPNVSRETLSLGEVADNVGEDEVMQDEAAIAVREAALRAAAEVPGANASGAQEQAGDPQPDVSRETSRTQANAPSAKAVGSATTDQADSSSEDSVPTVDTERAARDARVTFRIKRSPYNRFAIAVANQKGGVGKSTTAVNLGAYLALAGARVLVVDLDPQGNASTGLGLDHRQIEPSVYDVLMGDSDAASVIHKTPVKNLDVLPSTIDLAGAEVELVNAFSRETRLRQALGAVRYNYDLVFIDCPPSLGLLTVNALAAADELLIPIQCEYYALEGLGQLLRNVDLVRVNLNQALHIGGIVLTMYDGRTRLAEQVVQEVRKHFTDLVYQTVVPRSVRLSESPGYGVPIALYDPLSRGGIAYRDLALELADRTGLLAPTREGAN